MTLAGRARWAIAAALAAAVAIIVAVAATRRALPPPSANAPGTFSFAALGDAPYNSSEERRFVRLLADLEAHDLSFVLHVGDILGGACRDEVYQSRLAWFDRLRHPLVYTPGDNEWVDCWSRGAVPRERLQQLRRVFFSHPARSLGRRALPLVHQGPELVENARWWEQGLVFATVHLVGSENGYAVPARTAADNEEVARRTEAAAAWLRATFAEARERRATAVVVAFHAYIRFDAPASDRYRRAYEPFLAALEEEVERFAAPVLLIHGDEHRYRVDHPLIRRTTGRHLENLTRLEVPGAPDVGWVRVAVTPGASPSFSFEPRVVRRWPPW